MFYDNKMLSIEQYLRKISRLEKDLPDSTCDHSYVKHWSIHASSDRTKPARMLFMTALQRSQSLYV